MCALELHKLQNQNAQTEVTELLIRWEEMACQAF